VDATIDWGDSGAAEHVTTPGPHVHDYGVDGTYTVSVTGNVTAYNSNVNGGSSSEHKKLVSVDNWGQLGFTSMYRAFDRCSNLVSVPNTLDGMEAVTDMRYMFYYASAFNKPIGGWNTSSVTVMGMYAMFGGASSFNRTYPDGALRRFLLNRIFSISAPPVGRCRGRSGEHAPDERHPLG
jgi:surface protein